MEDQNVTKGFLKFERVNGRTSTTRLRSSYPLRFLSPTKANASQVDCVWMYTMNYGGGIVGGDNVHMTCEVGSQCTVLLTTQGSTKVYKKQPKTVNGNKGTHLEGGSNHSYSCNSRQHFQGFVQATGTLLILPDPFTCFRGSNYTQYQEIDLEEGGNLVLLDWYTSGRMGRGERWDFDRLEATTKITVGDQLLLWEPLLLEDTPSSPVSSRMGAYSCLCLLVIVGPRMTKLIHHVLETQGRPSFGSLKQRHIVTPIDAIDNQACISSVCRLYPGALALKVAGKTTQDVCHLLKSLLQGLEDDIIGAPIPCLGNSGLGSAP